eukprot:433125_1
MVNITLGGYWSDIYNDEMSQWSRSPLLETERKESNEEHTKSAILINIDGTKNNYLNLTANGKYFYSIEITKTNANIDIGWAQMKKINTNNNNNNNNTDEYEISKYLTWNGLNGTLNTQNNTDTSQPQPPNR